MHRPPQLTQKDIRDVFRLLAEVTEVGRDPAQWRQLMLLRLCPMIDARVGLIGEMYISPTNPSATSVLHSVDHGFEPHERTIFYHYLQTGAFATDPLEAKVARLMHRTFTRRRRDLVGDAEWYASPLVSDVRRRCNVDDTLYCHCRLPQHGWAQSISLLRSWNAKAYGTRERLLVSLLNRELGRLWSQVNTGPLSTLPPRLRQTLDLVFCGCSEKEMAHTLNVSGHTIHDFCRRLYRHFGVSGRSGLLTNSDCRRLLLCPALTPAYYAHNRRGPEVLYHGKFSGSGHTPKQAD